MKKVQGKLTGGRRAFGYDVVNGVKVPREDEQAVIRQMRAMHDAAHNPDPYQEGLIREAALEILVEVDPLVKTIYVRKGLLNSKTAAQDRVSD